MEFVKGFILLLLHIFIISYENLLQDLGIWLHNAVKFFLGNFILDSKF